ncbi:DUF3558 domain-containing protein [Amycolatopsis japonica]
MKRLLLLAAAISLVAGGCGTQVTGTATTSAPPSARLPSDGAPAVAEPITDTAEAETAPCSAVPRAQIEKIGGAVERTVTDNGALGKNCGWIFKEGPSNINAGLVVGNRDGLSALYAKHANGDFASFRPVAPIEGHPAVVYGTTAGHAGFCTLAVGLRDDLVYTVIPQLYPGHPMVDDPCGMAMRVAAAAIKQLKAP